MDLGTPYFQTIAYTYMQILYHKRWNNEAIHGTICITSVAAEQIHIGTSNSRQNRCHLHCCGQNLDWKKLYLVESALPALQRIKSTWAKVFRQNIHHVHSSGQNLH